MGATALGPAGPTCAWTGGRQPFRAPAAIESFGRRLPLRIARVARLTGFAPLFFVVRYLDAIGVADLSSPFRRGLERIEKRILPYGGLPRLMLRHGRS